MSLRSKQEVAEAPLPAEKFRVPTANEMAARPPKTERELLVDHVLRFLEQFGYSAA
jgi:hypothetical protein